MALVGELGEIVGHKAGLALTRHELAGHLVEMSEIQKVILLEEDQLLRIRSEEYEFAVVELLYALGNVPTRRPMFPAINTLRSFQDDPEVGSIAQAVLTRSLPLLEEAVANGTRGVPLDPGPIIEAIEHEFGTRAVPIVISFLENINLALHASPWSQIRSVEWEDEADLKELFTSESLDTRYGTFIDQRFIDYLDRNFDRVDDINWRKFEGLTGEFFDRAGFAVELGPGRADGGVDIRVWATNGDRSLSPLVLVQMQTPAEESRASCGQSLVGGRCQRGRAVGSRRNNEQPHTERREGPSCSLLSGRLG